VSCISVLPDMASSRRSTDFGEGFVTIRPSHRENFHLPWLRSLVDYLQCGMASIFSNDILFRADRAHLPWFPDIPSSGFGYCSDVLSRCSL
jgi:hypothetical protein